MSRPKGKNPPSPPPLPPRDRSPELPDVPSWAGAGVPTPIVDDPPTRPDGLPHTTSSPIHVHDERAFMQECADRLNGFLHSFPREAQHVLSVRVTYEHELVPVHQALAQDRLHGRHLPPEVSVAHLLVGILQSHHDAPGFVLRPVMLPDPDRGVGCWRITKFVVEEQEPAP